MANPELSRLAARLFNQYEVPVNKGLEWAAEIEKADSKDDLSAELKKFLEKPVKKASSISGDKEEQAVGERILDSSGIKITKNPFSQRMNDMSSVKVFIDGKWVSLDKIK
jgi:hypothetical protein